MEQQGYKKSVQPQRKLPVVWVLAQALGKTKLTCKVKYPFSTSLEINRIRARTGGLVDKALIS